MDKKKHSEEREELIGKMFKNFSVLRAALQIKQRNLADKVGIAQQTMLAIQNHKKPLPWSLYLALVLIFQQFDDKRELLEKLTLFVPEVVHRIKSDFEEGENSD